MLIVAAGGSFWLAFIIYALSEHLAQRQFLLGGAAVEMVILIAVGGAMLLAGGRLLQIAWRARRFSRKSEEKQIPPQP
jgi:hypothetical protein